MSTPPTRVVPLEQGGFTNAYAVETRPVLSEVPPELADRFLLVAELSRVRRPAEAVVLRVRDLTVRHGAPEIPLVLKWYHRLHAPGPDVEQELRELAEEEAPIWNGSWRPARRTATPGTCTGRTARRTWRDTTTTTRTGCAPRSSKAW